MRSYLKQNGTLMFAGTSEVLARQGKETFNLHWRNTIWSLIHVSHIKRNVLLTLQRERKQALGISGNGRDFTQPTSESLRIHSHIWVCISSTTFSPFLCLFPLSPPPACAHSLPSRKDGCSFFMPRTTSPSHLPHQWPFPWKHKALFSLSQFMSPSSNFFCLGWGMEGGAAGVESGWGSWPVSPSGTDGKAQTSHNKRKQTNGTGLIYFLPRGHFPMMTTLS